MCLCAFVSQQEKGFLSLPVWGSSPTPVGVNGHLSAVLEQLRGSQDTGLLLCGLSVPESSPPQVLGGALLHAGCLPVPQGVGGLSCPVWWSLLGQPSIATCMSSGARRSESPEGSGDAQFGCRPAGPLER